MSTTATRGSVRSADKVVHWSADDPASQANAERMITEARSAGAGLLGGSPNTGLKALRIGDPIPEEVEVISRQVGG